MDTTAKELPKPNLYGILSSLLPKMIENRSNFVWQGCPFFICHPVSGIIGANGEHESDSMNMMVNQMQMKIILSIHLE